MVSVIPERVGPTVIPFKNMSGKIEGHPHHPAIYGRYIVIDLDANNAIAIERFMHEYPNAPRPHLGFGVCRHGFGLQDLRNHKPMDEDTANAYAKALNDSTPIGVLEDPQETRDRVERVINELSH